MACGFLEACGSSVVATLVVDYVVKPIEGRIRYLFRFHKIVEELHQSQQKLATKQDEVKEEVKEAKLQTRTQAIKVEVDKWMNDAETAQKDVEGLESRIEEDKRCFRFCPNWCWRYQLSKEIEKTTSTIANLIKTISDFKGDVGGRAELPNIALVTPKVHVDLKSSDVTFNEIMEALKDAKVKKIGVWGMGGVGKTTLVTKVGGEVKGFDRVIMVTVSATPDNEKIQQRIAEEINLNFEKNTEEGKAAELWNRLNDGVFLIILDDLWDEWNDDEDLRKIGIPLVKNDKGCKIIVTTRDRRVCESMECNKTVPVNVLDDVEAWTLFKMKAGLEKAGQSVIVEAEKVVKECKGLPIAIVTLAMALKDKPLDTWKYASRKLARSELMEIPNIQENREKNAYVSLMISYDQLKDEMAQRCFLLCALYPEDHSIDVEDLVRYAWVLEFYDKAESVAECRIQVFETIDHLQDCCLLLEDGQSYNP